MSGHLTADAQDFATDTTILGRQQTTARVNWSGDDLGDQVYIQTPDISSIIQEIVNQAGWVSGNSLVVLCYGNAETGPEATRWTPYDNNPAGATKITINWTN